ncbi:hypothetical protein [Aquimarina sediminis]|uniref:hypothetical protein n=1 Tax=Aquimarina sediminis TaxID=2070536 RepID=UPI000CA00C19|nr:hypothetical protein [Aquimarina sediminis]
MRNIQLFIGLLFISFIGTSQNTNEIILKIRSEFQRINSLNQLEKIELDNEDFMNELYGHTTDSGGQLIGYFENGQLVKYTEWIGLHHGYFTTEYYFKNNKLFFVYDQEKMFKSVYDESGEWMNFDTSLEPETIFEGRYYFDNTKLIKKLTKGSHLSNRGYELSKILEHSNLASKILKSTKK